MYNLRNMKSRNSIKEQLNKDLDTTKEIVAQESITGIESEERSLASRYQSYSTPSTSSRGGYSSNQGGSSSQTSGSDNYPSYSSSNRYSSTQGTSSTSNYGAYGGSSSRSNYGTSNTYNSPTTNPSYRASSSSSSAGSYSSSRPNPEYEKLEDRYSSGDNSQYLDDWSPQADYVDHSEPYKKAESAGFDVSDLGLNGMMIDERRFKDVV
ncbi:unnamed protein product [Moneuplotes crassus]|uniref:Uncharacterized protein n=2 Tax=Euplotes crassus TaxID=5936 RepID=A0AAD2D368_EUPCR|nr:unnamed protein product [Moneuplotes crassus]